jgi:hypothetical protein
MRIKDAGIRIRNLQQFFLDIVFATVGSVFLFGLLGAADIIDVRGQDPFAEFVPFIAAALALSGIPYLLLGAYIVLAGGPSAFYSLKNPFLSREHLEAHFNKRLGERGYGPPKELSRDPELRVSVREKGAAGRMHAFALAFAPALDMESGRRLRRLIQGFMRTGNGQASGAATMVLLCVEEDTRAFEEFVRDAGEGLPENVVPAGICFGSSTLAFRGKIDGLAAGNRKRALQAFLRLLPDPMQYSDLKYPESMRRKERYPMRWTFNPDKVPKGIFVLWTISAFLLAAIGIAIGGLILSDGKLVAGAIVWVAGVLLAWVGIQQFRQARTGIK